MRKLGKRAISILVIVTFLMSMIPIMPASAVDELVIYTIPEYPTITAYSLFFTEQEGGSATVAMSEGKFHGGVQSAILTLPASYVTADEARLVFEYSGTLDTIDSVSFWQYLEESEWLTDRYIGPYVTMSIDRTGNGNADAWLVRDTQAYALKDVWTNEVFDEDSPVVIYASDLGGSWLEGPVPMTFAELLVEPVEDGPAIWGDMDVLQVKVGIGTWSDSTSGPIIAYVDDVYVNDVYYNMEQKGVDYDDTLTVSGAGVTSGSVVEVYWDYATGTGAHLLNTTLGKPDGTYEFEIDIPSDNPGEHFIWVVDVATDTSLKYPSALYLLPRIKLSPSSGLVGDELTVKGYGFASEVDVTVAFAGVIQTSTAGTDEEGYFTYKFDIPTDTAYGTYWVNAVDENGWKAFLEFTVGASITLDPDEGPTGTIFTIEGRGWGDAGTGIMTFQIGTTTVETVDGQSVIIGTDGKFSAEVVMPGVTSLGDVTITATEDPVSTPENIATDKFDVTGIPEIVVTPTYGTPGATITVTGTNFTQKSGIEVDIELWYTGETSADAYLVIAETKSDGTFEDTFISPAVTFKTYDVRAEDEYHIKADDAFKVGLIALIINPTSGESGTKVSLTGIGFANSDYNVTFTSADESYTKLYEDFGTVSGGAIADPFYVPNVEPGTYSLTVSDTDDNELTTTYVVTESTYVIANPAIAPNLYNVSLKGYNFADSAGLVDFVIYNSTIEEDMDVYTTTDEPLDPDPAATGTDGNFTAWWEVLDKDTLSIGDYTINVTGTEGLLVQIPFSVVAARVSVAPRKAQFDRGDMIQFDIDNDFILPLSYIEIYSPGDILYWSTDPFDSAWWMPVEGLHTVPYYRQTAAANPMELQSDAPMGAWLYIFFDGDDEQLMNGTFAVGPSTAAQIDELLEDVRSDLSGLADDLAGMSDEFAEDMAGMSDEFADDIAGLSDDFADDIAGLANDIAQATDAGQSALDAVEDLAGSMNDLGDAMSDMTDIVSETSDAAQSAADAANDAVQAAQDAQDKTSGLTTLVYGAIGASLIAALAAIVSLMQISKKIAG